MAKPNRTNPPQRQQPRPKPPASTVEVVDPRWLLRMLGLLIAAALVCGYLTLGLLFYLGSWQLALKPTHNPHSGTGLQGEAVHFGPDAAGTPQISGEWIPANAPAVREGWAVLYLRGGDGQLDAADGTQAAVLRDLGFNVLAFDYRGYGSSAAQPHPSERNMEADAEAARVYLQGVRHIAPSHIVVFGSGVGVSLAAQLMQQHPCAALIGYNADPDVLARVKRDPRSRLFPLGLVFHDRFPLDALKTIAQPKLLYSIGPLDAARIAVYRTAADPKTTVEVPTHNAEQERAALSRFLDQVAPEPALIPIMR